MLRWGKEPAEQQLEDIKERVSKMTPEEMRAELKESIARAKASLNDPSRYDGSIREE